MSFDGVSILSLLILPCDVRSRGYRRASARRRQYCSLFTSCIDCFNIVVAAKDLGRDNELLCTALSIQKLRLFLWGESVGLASRQGTFIPRPDCLRYIYKADLFAGTLGACHPGLDDPLINPVVLRTLQSLNHLLIEARNIDSRYAPQDSRPVLTRRTRALDLFRNSFEDFQEFQEAVQKKQKQKSVKTVTRWAIHDADKFEGIVKRLRSFIDGLQDITKALGVGPDQRARLKEEIESVADVESLRLIRDATGQEEISGVASQQLQQFYIPAVTEAPQRVSGMNACDTGPSSSAVPQVTVGNPLMFGPGDALGKQKKSNIEIGVGRSVSPQERLIGGRTQ